MGMPWRFETNAYDLVLFFMSMTHWGCNGGWTWRRNGPTVCAWRERGGEGRCQQGGHPLLAVSAFVSFVLPSFLPASLFFLPALTPQLMQERSTGGPTQLAPTPCSRCCRARGRHAVRRPLPQSSLHVPRLPLPLPFPPHPSPPLSPRRQCCRAQGLRRRTRASHT
jgi:hypothetical protein